MSDRLGPQFVILTIFPEIFPGPLGCGVTGKALEKGLFSLEARNLRDFADPPHRQVDDATFGGGAGMVLKPEPLFRAVEQLRQEAEGRRTRVILLDPGGRRLDQALAHELAAEERLVLVCGRYEGVDHRVREEVVDDEVSIGDYVLSGGELPAMALIDAVARLVPGVVGQASSVENESFEGSGLDHPHYTRPADFRGLKVPEVLLSGHHAEIESWRRQAAEQRTRRRRPDLVAATSSPAPGGGARKGNKE